jgi:hypothetical protein
MSTEHPQRRSSDVVVNQLVADVAELKDAQLKQVAAHAELSRKMDLNTSITEQVRDILATFRIMAQIAKWVTAIVAGVTAAYHGIASLKG